MKENLSKVCNYSIKNNIIVDLLLYDKLILSHSLSHSYLILKDVFLSFVLQFLYHSWQLACIVLPWFAHTDMASVLLGYEKPIFFL